MIACAANWLPCAPGPMWSSRSRDAASPSPLKTANAPGFSAYFGTEHQGQSPARHLAGAAPFFLRRQTLVNCQVTSSMSSTLVVFVSIAHLLRGAPFCCLVPCHLLAALLQGEQIALWVPAKATLLSAGFLPGVECFPQRPPANKAPCWKIGCLIWAQAGTHTGQNPRLPS